MTTACSDRRFVSPLLFGLAMLGLVVGCGSESTPEPLATSFKLRPQTEVRDPAIDPELAVNLAVITAASDAYANSVNAGANEAAEELEVDVLDLRSPEDGSVEQQNALCRQMLREDIMGVGVCPIDPYKQTPTIDQLNGEIETITFGTDAPASQRQIHVGADSYQMGRDCKQLLAALVPDGGKVVLVTDHLDGGPESLRRQGLIDAILDRDRTAQHYRSSDDAWDPMDESIAGETFSIVATLVDDEDSDRSASDQLAELIKSNGDIVATIALCGRCIPKTLDAVDNGQVPEGMKWVGLGYDPSMMQAIEQGRCHAAIVADPHPLGRKVVEVLYNVVQLQRSKFPKDGFAVTPAIEVTRDNVESLLSQWQAAAAPQ